MDGLAACVFFEVFVWWWNLTTRLSLTAILLSLPNSICTTRCDWLRALVHLYIVMNHSARFAESSRAPALWRHYWDVNNQNMAMLLIFQGRLAMFMEQISALNHYVNMTKSISIKKERSKVSRQVRFFLANALYFLIKLMSPKLHFYLKFAVSMAMIQPCYV